MSPLFQEILSLIWVNVKQSDKDTGILDEETFRFFEKTSGQHTPSPAFISNFSQGSARVTTRSAMQPSPKNPPATLHKEKTSSLPPQQPKAPKEVETPLSEEPQSLPLPLVHKHDKLLPKTFSYTPVDTFTARKNIQKISSMPRLRDGCLYEKEERRTFSWAFFSFPLPTQEEQFLVSVLNAVKDRLQKKVLRFSCLDASFPINIALSASDSEKIFFFIEPHNESTLKKLLESIPNFSSIPPKEMDPFLSLGTIDGNALHLFLLTPQTASHPEIKTRLWLTLKNLAFASETP